MPLPDFLANFTRTSRTRRSPMDERLPDGRTVAEAAAGVTSPKDMMMRTGEPAAGEPLAVDAPPDDGSMTRPRVVARPVEQARNRQAEMRADLPVESDPTLPPGDVSRMPQEAVPAREVAAATTTTPPQQQQQSAPAREPWMERLRSEQDRLAALDADENPKDRNGRLVSTLMGVARGFSRGGLIGAAAEGIRSGIAPNADERLLRDARKVRTTARIGQLNTQRKADADYEQSAAQTEYLRARPGIEAGKSEAKRKYDEWRMKSGDRKQDSAAAYIEWKKQNGDRNATTAEGRLALAEEWRTVIQPEQFERTFDQREDHFNRTQQATQRRFDQTFGLNIDKFIEGQRHSLVGESQKSFDVATKDRIPRLKAIHVEIERWQRRKAEGSTRAGEADNYISELQGEALQIAGQIEAVREAVLSGGSAPQLPAPNNAAPVRRSVPGAPIRSTRPSSSPAPAVDEQTIRAKAVAAGLDPDELVRRARLRGTLR